MEEDLLPNLTQKLEAQTEILETLEFNFYPAFLLQIAVETLRSHDLTLTGKQKADLKKLIEQDLVPLLEKGTLEPTPQTLAIILVNFLGRSSNIKVGSPSNSFLDIADPYKIPVNYQGTDLRLNPKRGKYGKWFNLIRFNADQHFPERYQSAYKYFYNQAAKDADLGPSDPHLRHERIDRDARSAVYQTLTGPQLADYYRRLSEIESNEKLLPKNDELKPSKKIPKTHLWSKRATYFGEQPQLPEMGAVELLRSLEQGKRRLERAPPKPTDTTEELGEDLDLPELMTQDEYFDARQKVRDLFYRILIKSEIIRPEEKLSRNALKRREEFLENEVDKYMRNNFLPYALKKPRSRWYSTFWGLVGTHYPDRYRAIAQNDDLDLYADSSKLRHETYQAFNQKQLDDWVDRVTYETNLMGKGEWLPTSRDLRLKPDFSEENREERLEQFLQYLEENPRSVIAPRKIPEVDLELPESFGDDVADNLEKRMSLFLKGLENKEPDQQPRDDQYRFGELLDDEEADNLSLVASEDDFADLTGGGGECLSPIAPYAGGT